MAERATKEPRAISNQEALLLLELGLTGQLRPLERVARGIARRNASTNPEVAVAISDIVTRSASSAGNGVLRGAANTHLPLDQETQVPLLRDEFPVVLASAPIWANDTEQQLNVFIEERERANELLSHGLRPSRSALFHGPPGVGKTLAARWLASKLNVPLLVLDLASVISSFLGKTGMNIKNVLDFAKNRSCVLLLDELDAIAKRRDDSAEVGELKRLVTVLLQELDDWSDSAILLAATNHATLLDPAVWRRFDHVIAFPLPDKVALERLIRHELDSTDRKIVELLKIVLADKSHSEVVRSLKALRRHTLLRRISVEEFIKDFVRAQIALLPRTERILMAKRLYALGLSQRDVHAMSGVSRDTLRRSDR